MSLTPAAQFALNWLRQNAPTPSDAHEAVALAVHAILLHYEFRPSNTTTATTTTTTTTTETIATNETQTNENNNNNNVPTTLPSDWGGAGYGGQYRHIRSAMLFDIRAVRMGGRLLVHAVAGEDDNRLNTVDVRVDNFYTNNNNTENVWDRMNDMNGLGTLVAIQIAHRLVPEGSKHGYEDNTNTNETGQSSSSSSVQQTPTPVPGPRPVVPDVNDNNDPLRIGPIRNPRYPLINTQNPHAIGVGHDDLLPSGLPPPGFLDGRFGNPTPSGNLMGPNHFNNNNRNIQGNRRLPPGVPQGARFDPYGVNPDPDAEFLPGFEDDHRLRGGTGTGTGGAPQMFPRRGGGGGPGGMGDDGPPPGMFF